MSRPEDFRDPDQRAEFLERVISALQKKTGS